MRSPLIIAPIVRPRVSPGTRLEAKGIIKGGTTLAKPITRLELASKKILGAVAKTGADHQ